MIRLFILLFLIPSISFAESIFRDPFEFLKKHLVDFSLGPGYTVNENIRRDNKKTSKETGTTQSVFPLYDFRLGPVNITNVYSQPGFTIGKSLRIGLLLLYLGDEYESDTVELRKKSLFGGGFVGYGPVTAYAYSDLLKRHAGSIYALRIAPSLVRFGKNEFFLILEGQHMNRTYVDYYFGVREGEAAPQIPAYRGVETTNLSGNLLYVLTASKVTSFLLWGGEKRYGRGVTDSPTVTLHHEYSAGVGLLFKLL